MENVSGKNSRKPGNVALRSDPPVGG